MNVKPIEQAAQPLVKKAEVILESTLVPKIQKAANDIDEFRPLSEPISSKILDKNDSIEAIAKEAGIGEHLDVLG